MKGFELNSGVFYYIKYRKGLKKWKEVQSQKGQEKHWTIVVLLPPIKEIFQMGNRVPFNFIYFLKIVFSKKIT